MKTYPCAGMGSVEGIEAVNVEERVFCPLGGLRFKFRVYLNPEEPTLIRKS